MPLQATSGAASYDAFGGGVPVVPTYIEDVFSTYLYTGNGSVQGIANGINLGTTYGGSGYFGGASAAGGLTAPASSSWQLTGDYTVEAWIYVVTLANGTIYATGGSGAADQFTYTSAGELYFANQGTGTGVITAGSWIHVAAARSGTTQKIFINGVVQSTTTVSGTIGQNATAYIGRRVDTTNYVTGYISNLRVVKGTAVYTSNFTPSTVPLTAITNTVLLTCQANGFVDASTNAFTITNTNAIAVTNYGPFTSSTAGKGGLVWFKSRSYANQHALFDTVRGNSSVISSDQTYAANNFGTPNVLTSFNSNGFSLGQDNYGWVNSLDFPQVSWTFRKQPKFFDIVTWTGNYPTDYPRVISHNLGSTPGCVIIKCTSNVGSWGVWHRSISTGDYNANATLFLNSTAASVVYGNVAGPFTSTTITVGEDLNQSGRTYVAYLFAHDAGGFGLTGTDNVISCGSFTTDGSSNFSVNLGYEPQWILAKQATGSANNWAIFDNMRGMSNTNVARLIPNSSAAETDFAAAYCVPTATGFYSNSGGFFDASQTVIYIAIRRGPMKVPTVGTSIFNTLAHTGDAGDIEVTGVGFPPDLLISKWRSGISGTQEAVFLDRLRGTGKALFSNGTGSENSWEAYVGPLGQDGVKTTTGQNAIINKTGDNNAWWFMKRAPSVFDEVCYTGTGSTHVEPHNLQKLPEMVICKSRGVTGGWLVGVNNAVGSKAGLFLNQTAANSGNFNASNDSTTGFDVEAYGANVSGRTYVAWLFATCPGVSKVGTYTGDGTNYKDINCGFTSGARFVMIKRTDAAGDWYVFDTARGITTGSDKILRLNSTAAEITSDEINPLSTGFSIGNNNYPGNVSGGTYIFLAIA